MSGKQPEELWHPNQLAPMMLPRQHDHDLEQYDPLPSMSPYGMAYHARFTPPDAAHLLNQSADPTLYLPYQSSYRQPFPYEEHGYEEPSLDESLDPALRPPHQRSYSQHSPYEIHGYQYPSPDDGHHHGEQQSQISNSAVVYSQHSPQSSLPALQDGRSVRAAKYQAKLAAVSGVVTPSKRAPGEMPLKPPDTLTRSNDKHSLRCCCPICGAAFTRNYHVQSHFVTCEARNGNPNGARWNDGLYIPGRGGSGHGSEKKAKQTRQTAPDSQTSASASQSSHSSPTSKPKQSERTRIENDKMNAVSGVVIPSKLAEGKSPMMNVGSYASGHTPRNFFCPLCKGAFGKKDHVKSHFPSCVGRNGNPDGLRWDDGLPLLKRGPKATYQRAGGEGVAGAIFRREFLMSSRKGQERSRSLSPWGCFD